MHQDPVCDMAVEPNTAVPRMAALPPTVSGFQSQLKRSAGVIISTPEYAHGVPGVLKNALDWLVASGELYEKPVAIFSASPYARFAPASLIETLTVMMARLIADALVNVSPPLGIGDGALDVTADAGLPTRIERALAAFASAIQPTHTDVVRASHCNTTVAL